MCVYMHATGSRSDGTSFDLDSEVVQQFKKILEIMEKTEGSKRVKVAAPVFAK